MDMLARIWAIAVMVASSATAALVLEGDGIRLAFDTAESGFNCVGIENRLGPDPATFCGDESGRPGFWELTFWQDGSPTNALTIDNLAPCKRDFARDEKSILFAWHGLALGDEKDAVDVRASVALTPDGAAAARKTVTIPPRGVVSEVSEAF